MTYSGPAIDTHHHIWLRKDVGWLADPPVPRMFGDYFGIRRDYPVEEFIQDVKPQGVTKSVHVTAMWGPGKALEETRWLQSVADKNGFPHGIVSNVDLADPGLRRRSRRRRISQRSRCAADALLGRGSGSARRATRRFLQFAGLPARLCAAGKAQPAFRAASLRRAGRSRRRADQSLSGVKMILVHAGMLTARTQAAIDQWRMALTAMAAFPTCT